MLGHGRLFLNTLLLFPLCISISVSLPCGNINSLYLSWLYILVFSPMLMLWKHSHNFMSFPTYPELLYINGNTNSLACELGFCADFEAPPVRDDYCFDGLKAAELDSIG
ncbi:hypothetical protein GOP47_0002516 [Adiantum capillus-veneris]|uniref:Uncharacterized protein n=1 Tax=Adiantum capillus-veneris TaxID=13818 RepID=A0A9D4VBX1_ADICA|nr:hypothetical protein GOP47_0002516 [Adiantum capillus-veneris]